MLEVGIPREIKPREKRVGLTPAAAEALAREGIGVRVEKGAGSGSGFPDAAYERAGAKLAPHAREIYRACGLVQKVKEPQPAEYGWLREGQILFAFLHLASPENCALVEALALSKATAIGYETLEAGGRLPILAPMSEIAGGLGAAYGAYFCGLDLVRAGRLVYPPDFQTGLEALASAYPKWDMLPLRPESALIFGGGVAGEKALEVLRGLGGQAAVIEANAARREELRKRTPHVFAPGDDWGRVLDESRLLIGCVHRRGERAARVLEEEVLRSASRKRPKILIDVAIDQGGNFPLSRPTTYDDPLYLDAYGNLRFAVPNIPSLAGGSASEALARETLRYTIALAKDPAAALERFPELRSAVNIESGRILLPAVKQAHRR